MVPWAVWATVYLRVYAGHVGGQVALKHAGTLWRRSGERIEAAGGEGEARELALANPPPGMPDRRGFAGP